LSDFDKEWRASLESINATGQAFLDVLLGRYHGDYLWASVEE